MPKPRIQSRVDPHVKTDVEEFAEGQDMTQAEAVRYLVQSGIEHEQQVRPDGGEVLDRVQSLEASQRQEERQRAYQNALTGVAIIAALAMVAGINNAAVLALGGLSGIALISTALFPLVGGSGE